MENPKRRKPAVALLLSLITPGLGQMYNGRLKRGVILYLGGISLATMFSLTGLFLKFYGMVLSLVILFAFLLFVWLDAFIGALKLKQITLRPYNKWYLYLIAFLICTFFMQPLATSWIRNKIARAYKIPSSGMESALLVGDYFIADMGIYKKEKPKRGDIIVFEFPKDPSKEFVKRVIGLDGEKVEIIKNKIHINGQLIVDPWGHYKDEIQLGGTTIPSPGDRFGPVVVPRDSLFVLGDNRDNSQDSRYWGFVVLNRIKGKALYIYWAKDKTRIGMTIR